MYQTDVPTRLGHIYTGTVDAVHVVLNDVCTSLVINELQGLNLIHHHAK